MPSRRPKNLSCLATLFLVFRSSPLAPCSAFSSIHHDLTHRRCTSRLAAIATSPQDFNEFSRKISTEKILGGRQNRRSNYRDFHIDLEATSDECEALAKRFQLQAISALQASLSLRPAFTGDEDIQVEGAMQASLTQKCVRTNDSFEISVEFPVDMVVRPVQPEIMLFQDYESQPSTSKQQQQKKKKKKKQTQRTSSSSKSISDLDLSELQRMVNSDILHDTDNVIEDEAVLTVGSMLDVGELVSQLFWLSLDPYPKKPGSEWSQTSITG